MTEIYHYHDDKNVEYKQRILLNKSSCFFCEIDKKELLIQCKECEKLFCNGENIIPKSHIIYHLQKSNHKVISLYPFEKNIQCDKCKDNNIFNLYFSKYYNYFRIFCKEHIPKEEEDYIISYIEENRRFSTDIIQIPSQKEDIKKLLDTTLIEIHKRENIIEDTNYVVNRFLNKVKDKYDSKDEYYIIHKPLILCELEYARKISENNVSTQIRITEMKREYKNKPFYKFLYNRIYDKPFKIGCVYNFTKIDSNMKSLGLIVDIKENVCFLIPVEQSRDIFEEDTYIVKEEFCSLPYDRMISGLDNFYKDNYNNISLNLTYYILGKTDEIYNEDIEVSSLLNPFSVYQISGYGKLNESQRNAIRNTRKHVLNLIQGPPGTGKTFTASFLIYNIFLSRRNNSHKILICAPTNAAADNLSLSLLNLRNEVLKEDGNAKMFKILRIVARTREYIEYDERVKKISLQNLVNFDNDKFKEKTEKIINKTDIVITTCSTSLIEKLDEYQFKFVIIDESTQSQEVETLITMLKSSRHVTLIGDPQQLSPTILHPKGKQTGMHISLFERMLKIKPEICSFLNIQYRMHPKISEFISQHFYERKLLDVVSVRDRNKWMFNIMFNWPNSNFPIVFINVEGKDKISSSGTSYVNEKESLTLVRIIKHKFCRDEIRNTCVITPYFGQKELLEDVFNLNNIYVDVSSVDSFQGQESDFIVINTVRNNANHEIGFLKDVKRLNVSISRAKYGLIIIGNVECLYNAKIDNKYSIWRTYINYINDNNALVTYNHIENKFEKYVLKIQGSIEYISEDNYEEKYDYDGSNNNYKCNLDLIYKDSEDCVNQRFYFNPIKITENNPRRSRNKHRHRHRQDKRKRFEERKNRHYYRHRFSYHYYYCLNDSYYGSKYRRRRNSRFFYY